MTQFSTRSFLRLIFSFRGRIGRVAYLCLGLGGPLAAFELGSLAFSAHASAMGGWDQLMAQLRESGMQFAILIAIIVICTLLALWIFTAAAARRCHDLRFSGFWAVLFTLVVLYALGGSMNTVWIARALLGFAALMLAALPGEKVANRLGEPPGQLFSVGLQAPAAGMTP